MIRSVHVLLAAVLALAPLGARGADLEPRPGALKLERAASRTLRHAGAAVVNGARRLRPGSRRAISERTADPDDLADD